MSATALAPLNRAEINRANSRHSTGPRTDAGKQRSSRNALRHGLTAASPVLPTEDAAAYASHRLQFLDEYKPATPTETQLVQELIDTSWRLNRIPVLEAHLLSRALDLTVERDPIANTLTDSTRALATLSTHGARLSRQFQKALDQLRDLQTERRHRDQRALREAASLLELHRHKGLPWEPADDGFVFSKEEIQRWSRRTMRQTEARHAGCVLFDMYPSPDRAAALAAHEPAQQPGA